MPSDSKNTQAATDLQGKKGSLKWSSYAPHYDEMSTFIPAYQENIDTLIDSLPSLNLPPNPKILDLGAGTGNYILAMSSALPGATFTHVDVDPVMISEAEKKYAQYDVNATFVENYIQRVDFDLSSFDLIVCVNALGHASPQVPILRRMSTWLKPSGKLFLISFGRPVKIIDWAWYVFRNAVKNVGVMGILRAFYRNRQIFLENARAKNDQKEGSMWLHSSDEFKDVLERGSFNVLQFRTCYRGYSDLAICEPHA